MELWSCRAAVGACNMSCSNAFLSLFRRKGDDEDGTRRWAHKLAATAAAVKYAVRSKMGSGVSFVSGGAGVAETSRNEVKGLRKKLRNRIRNRVVHEALVRSLK